MLEGIYFEYPVLGLTLLLFLVCARWCPMRLSALYFPHTGRFARESAAPSHFLTGLKWLGITMLVIAFMSPVKDHPVDIAPNQGYDMALVIDASQSMQAKGFDLTDPGLSRFDVVQRIVRQFIEKRQHDNMGLVVFGEYAFIAAPLTYDRHILSRVVEQLHVGMAGKFTALYEAIGQSVNLLQNAKAKSKIVIVLTDGYNTPGGKIPLESALQMAQKNGIRIYTIGIGGPNEYNGALLHAIAKESGGKAYAAHNAEQLQKIYAEIDTLEKSEIETQRYRFTHYYYLYPLFIGVMSLLLYVYRRNRKGVA